MSSRSEVNVLSHVLLVGARSPGLSGASRSERVQSSLQEAPESKCRIKPECTYIWSVPKSSCSLMLSSLNESDDFFLERHEPNRFFFFFFSVGLAGDKASARGFGKLSYFFSSSLSWDLDLEVRKIFLNLKGFCALMIAEGIFFLLFAKETLFGDGEARALEEAHRPRHGIDFKKKVIRFIWKRLFLKLNRFFFRTVRMYGGAQGLQE